MTLIIDCDACVMQHTSACDDCIVTVLLSDGSAERTIGPVELDEQEAVALGNLAAAGLTAPLRLVQRRRGPGSVAR